MMVALVALPGLFSSRTSPTFSNSCNPRRRSYHRMPWPYASDYGLRSWEKKGPKLDSPGPPLTAFECCRSYPWTRPSAAKKAYGRMRVNCNGHWSREGDYHLESDLPAN